LETLYAITALATHGLKPDLTLFFDIAPREGLKRRLLSGEEWNRLDAEEIAFHQRVRAGYWELIEAEPERWCVIAADRPMEVVQADVVATVSARLRVR
jgi:dTMP kinase